jgi:hypothetical protein
VRKAISYLALATLFAFPIAMLLKADPQQCGGLLATCVLAGIAAGCPLWDQP